MTSDMSDLPPVFYKQSELEAAVAAARAEERTATVTKINKLLSLQSSVDLERWEQLEIYVHDLQADLTRLRTGMAGLVEKWTTIVNDMKSRYSPPDEEHFQRCRVLQKCSDELSALLEGK